MNNDKSPSHYDNKYMFPVFKPQMLRKQWYKWFPNV